jgi:hypothetical protein
MLYFCVTFFADTHIFYDGNRKKSAFNILFCRSAMEKYVLSLTTLLQQLVTAVWSTFTLLLNFFKYLKIKH